MSASENFQDVTTVRKPPTVLNLNCLGNVHIIRRRVVTLPACKVVLVPSNHQASNQLKASKSNQCDVDYAKANDIFAELEKQSSIFSASQSGLNYDCNSVRNHSKLSLKASSKSEICAVNKLNQVKSFSEDGGKSLGSRCSVPTTCVKLSNGSGNSCQEEESNGDISQHQNVKETVEPPGPCDASEFSGRDIDPFLSVDEPFLELNFVDDPFVKPQLAVRKLTGNIKGKYLSRGTDEDFIDSKSDSDLSEDDFIPKNKIKVAVTCADVLKESHKKTRKKQGVYIKESEITKAIFDVEEESNNSPSYTKVHDMMPSCSPYVVTGFESIDQSDMKWVADVRADITNREQAFEWLAEFEGLNSLDLRVLQTKAENSKRLVFKRVYRCHHNTVPKKEDVSSKIKSKQRKNFISKNTNCPAFVRITIKQKSMKWSSDMLLKKYPCEISIHHNHNHPVHAADALRRRRPCAATQEKIIELLKKGHSPLSALECHKFDLRKEHGENYFKAVADGSICPSNFWIYKLFKKLSLKQYGPQCGVEMIQAVKKFCDEYNNEKGFVCCKMEEVQGTHITVAICTPLMRRVHQLLKSSVEIMFMDSSGNMDFMNCRVFLLLTPSVAGGMPLGILITTSESEEVVHSALELWKTLLPQDAFYGRGPSVGPKLIMTDDSTPERNALKLSFHDAILLLCLFHVLQAFWRYLWAREQNVPKEKRSELFYLFKDLVYAESGTIFQERWKEALSHEELNKYHKVKTHLENFIPRSAEWALFQRLHLLTRGNQTNNYCEANIRILKEKVMNRLKAFNLVQLLDFMLTRYDSYVESRFIDVVNNRAPNPFKSRYFFPAEKLVDLKCQKLDKYPNSYCVKNISKGTVYFVLMEWEICSCEAGKCGRPCKHMCAVVQHFNLSSSLIHPLLQCHNSTMKRVLFHIAHGHVNVPDEWFKSVFDEVHEKSQESESGPSSDIQTDSDPSKYPEDWHMSIFGEQTQQQPAQSCSENDSSDKNDEQEVDDPPAISDADEGSKTNSEESDFPDDILNETKDALRATMENYIQLLSDNPQTFLEPMGVFIKQNRLLCNSQAGLVSALHCFGKNGGAPAHGFKKRKGRDIPVQPTAVARRTTYLGGTKRQFTGRPPNAMRSNVLEDTSDHTYGVTVTMKRKPHEPVWSSLPKRSRMPATHRLARCVESSQNIGSTHSRK